MTAHNRHDEEEKNKYEQMWLFDSYRERSPGERFFQRAFADMKPEPGDTMCDWGIGTGRAASMFQKEGLHVEGLDIAINAVSEFEGLVHIGTMWEPTFPVGTTFKFGYCTDVMEHLPPDCVLEALKAVKRHTTRECWFSIANFHDHEGDKIGQRLHLSVRPADWWAAGFARVFHRFIFSTEPKHFIVRAFI